MSDEKVIQLVSISAYSLANKISRPTIYKLIDEGKLTKYEDKQTGEPRLDLNELPKGLRRYTPAGEGRLRKTK